MSLCSMSEIMDAIAIISSRPPYVYSTQDLIFLSFMLRLPSCLGVAGLGSPSLHFGLGCAGLGLVGWGRARVEGRGLGLLGRDWAGCAPHRRLAYVVRVGFAPSGLSSGSGWAAFARAKRV